MKAILGDITQLKVDAIVNAANKCLRGGGGVDGAIHRAAGPELLRACEAIGGCPTGQARITPGFNLPAKYVIHTVGPIWHDDTYGEKDFLASCYQSSLELALKQEDIQTIAFPCISTGVYRFPAELAADIAVSTCKGSPLDITFCCFSEEDYELYCALLK